jgi:nucleoside-triphosphatase
LKRLILITGQPSIGKTTILFRTASALKSKGYKIGGMVSCEVREGGARVGFEIVDLETVQKGWLAHVNQPTGPKLGKYRVNLSDLNAIGASSILHAVADANVVVVDEIGPMELFSPAFKEAVSIAIESEKPVIGTIHYRARDPLINAIKAREDAEILEVTRENREQLHNLIIDKVINHLTSSSY